MSKTYWLVSSNSKPVPTKRKNELYLQGVNAYSVCELIKSEEYPNIFICTNSDKTVFSYNSTVYSRKQTFKQKASSLYAACKLLPCSLKLAIPVIFLYLIAFIFATIYFPEDWPVYIAFMATCDTFIITFFNALAKDKIFGTIVVLLLGGIVGLVIGNIYFSIVKNKGSDFFLFNPNNIGNLLTIISLIITFIGYVKDLFSVYLNESRI